MNSKISSTVLSTKLLSPSQKELLLNGNTAFVEYDAIAIEFLSFKWPKNAKNVIFSSKNAIKSLKRSDFASILGEIENCFCVGDSTKALLEKNGQKVTKMAKNASELADFIKKSYKNESFYFFCGNMRRDEIPSISKDSKNTVFEVKTYKTTLKPIKFDRKFDGILFFSPSGVQSFTSENIIDTIPVFCIGDTTASEAKKHTENVIIANTASVESVIAKAVKTLKNDKN